MNKTVTALTLAVAFMFVATISSANTTTLKAGQSSVCVQASWVAVAYTPLRAHETVIDLVGRRLLEKNKSEIGR